MNTLIVTTPEGDRTVARRECYGFLRGVCAAGGLAQNAVGATVAAACAAGLPIPRTVVTSDLAVVRAFARSVPGGVVYKGFTPAVWRRDGGSASGLVLMKSNQSRIAVDGTDTGVTNDLQTCGHMTSSGSGCDRAYDDTSGTTGCICVG